MDNGYLDIKFKNEFILLIQVKNRFVIFTAIHIDKVTMLKIKTLLK